MKQSNQLRHAKVYLLFYNTNSRNNLNYDKAKNVAASLFTANMVQLQEADKAAITSLDKYTNFT